MGSRTFKNNLSNQLAPSRESVAPSAAGHKCEDLENRSR
jgi:hypothetical protein